MGRHQSWRSHSWGVYPCQVYDGLVSAIESEQAGTEGTERPLELSVDQAGLVWIQYMRFLRRTDGNTAARKVGRVHPCPRCGQRMLMETGPCIARLECHLAHTCRIHRRVSARGAIEYSLAQWVTMVCRKHVLPTTQSAEHARLQLSAAKVMIVSVSWIKRHENVCCHVT